jgi:16S rRNA (guanine527-N7)-methyltransferase
VFYGKRRGEIHISNLNFKEFFSKKAKELDITLSEEALNMFDVYKSVLQDWNETRFNLTAITDDTAIAMKHFIDSLEVSTAIKLTGKNLSVIDIGSGAGFPGLPLKIAFPNLKVTLLDSQRKRTLFLTVLLRKLVIDDVAVFNARAEELVHDKDFREKFNIALARELGKLPVNIEIGMPFLKKGGYLALWKGKDEALSVEKYEKFINKLGGRIEKVKNYKLDTERERYLVIIKKTGLTPSKYPRTYSSIMRSIKKGEYT